MTLLNRIDEIPAQVRRIGKQNYNRLRKNYRVNEDELPIVQPNNRLSIPRANTEDIETGSSSSSIDEYPVSSNTIPEITNMTNMTRSGRNVRPVAPYQAGV